MPSCPRRLHSVREHRADDPQYLVLISAPLGAISLAHRYPHPHPHPHPHLHTPVLTANLNLGADSRKLDKHHVAERPLRIVRNADGTNLGLVVVRDPLVVLRVAGLRASAQSQSRAACY